MFIEYLFILKYFIFCLFVVLILCSLSLFLVFQKPDVEKLSAYECGFNTFSDARNKFEVKFYLIGVLFIIFDLEITFLFPWLIVIMDLNIFGMFSMFIFLIILTVGFFFEWSQGALNLE